MGLKTTIRSFALAFFTGLASRISKFSLSPIYGGFPTSAYHEYITFAAYGVGILGFWLLGPRRWSQLTKFIPILASSVPVTHLFISKHSNVLGPLCGPLATELVTYFPLLVTTIGAILVSTSRSLDSQLIRGIPLTGLILFCSFPPVYDNFAIFLSHVSLDTTTLHLLLSALYALLLPSKYLTVAGLMFGLTIRFNPHLSTNMANKVLAEEGFRLIDRRQSLTGYISVLDNVKEGYRVMRCDHSLLGGIWTHHLGQAIAYLREPVFAIFVVLEAVRLMKPTVGFDTLGSKDEREGEKALAM